MWRTGALIAAGLILLSACERPAWTVPENSRGPRSDATDLAKADPALPPTAAAAPRHPAWADTVMGRNLREVYGKTGVCRGNLDNIRLLYRGDPPGVRVVGWGWDQVTGEGVPRVVLVDKDYLIVGAGDGGWPRKDVPRVVPEITATHTGWSAVTPNVSGALDAYGVVDGGKAICPLGHLEF